MINTESIHLLTDRDFRKHLRADPRKYAPKLGYDTSDDSLKFIVLTNTEEQVYLPLLDNNAMTPQVIENIHAAGENTTTISSIASAGSAGTFGSACTSVGTASTGGTVSTAGSAYAPGKIIKKIT